VVGRKRKSKPDGEALAPVPKRFSSKTDKEIVEHFLTALTELDSIDEALFVTCQALGVSKARASEVMRKACLREQAKDHKKELYEKVYKEKIPLVESIVGLSLTNLQTYLENLSQHPEQLFSLSPRDASSLAAMAIKLNEMLRLELGKSTQNIDVNVTAKQSLEVTVNALQKLKAVDPVFEYPEMPALDITENAPD
jgi:hypothetical protein